MQTGFEQEFHENFKISDKFFILQLLRENYLLFTVLEMQNIAKCDIQ